MNETGENLFYVHCTYTVNCTDWLKIRFWYDEGWIRMHFKLLLDKPWHNQKQQTLNKFWNIKLKQNSLSTTSPTTAPLEVKQLSIDVIFFFTWNVALHNLSLFLLLNWMLYIFKKRLLCYRFMIYIIFITINH